MIVLMGAIAGKISDWLPHMWHWILACIPAVTVASGKAKINTAQIIQFLIVAGVGGMIAGYITLTKLEVKFDMIVDKIVNIENSVKEIRKDFYKPHLPGH
jgi:hypothetical protein